MKRLTLFTFIACATLALLNNAAWAQSAPATLTAEERSEAAKYLAETRKNFLESVKGLSEAQWKFKPAPDKWSVAEVAPNTSPSAKRRCSAWSPTAS